MEFELDILGQQPLLQIYTQLCFCFPISDSSVEDSIAETLSNGFEKLSNVFPWISGQVVNVGASEDSTGIFKVTEMKNYSQLTFKNLHNDPNAPNWSRLKKLEFPMNLLDEDIIAPRRTLPGGPGWSPTEIKPVFLIQCNFIDGGVIITFNAHHAVMDMTGQSEMIRLFNKACNEEEFTKEEIKIGNMSRSGSIPKSTNYNEDKLNNFLMDPNAFLDFQNLPKASWCYFSFNKESLIELKAKAMSDLSTAFISSDDSLTAFIWKSISRAREPRLGDSYTTVLARAVDMRQYIGLPASYPGLLQSMSFQDFIIGDIIKDPLGLIASRLRSELDKDKLVEGIKSLASFIEIKSDKSCVSFVAKMKSSSDVQVSSWSKVKAFEFDFNLRLGFPESVRRPHFTPCESLIYFMPKRPDGEVSVAISLRDEDLDRLKKDAIFLKYCKVIG